MENLEPKTNIFTRRPGSQSLSIFDKGNRSGPKSTGRYFRGDTVNLRDIAKDVERDGSVELFHDLRPPRPFEKFSKFDAFDMHDFNAPLDNSIDKPSLDLERVSRNVCKSPTPLEEMEPIVDDAGVKKYLHKEGSSEEISEIQDGYRVWIHYNLFVDKGDEGLLLLDSTKRHGLATSLVIGEDGILGLYFGVKTMKKKEIAEFIIESNYGYGKMGIPGFIDGNQRLRLVVQLEEISVKSRKSAAFMDGMEKLAANLTFEDVLADVEQLIQAGRKKFERGYYREASDRYTWALDVIQDFSKKPALDDCEQSTGNQKSQLTPGEEEALDKKCYQIYCNLALCYNKLEDYEETVNACESALKLAYHQSSLRPKLLHRYATALYHLENYEDAIMVCERGSKCLWGDVEFRDLKYKIQVAIEGKMLAQEREEKEKQTEGNQETEDASPLSDSSKDAESESLKQSSAPRGKA